jgi:hypothetical protein
MMDKPVKNGNFLEVITVLEMRRAAGSDILDYQQVVSLLGRYAKPRDRISAMLDKGELVRVRKGLYVVGDVYRREPVALGQLANLVYGPSYVSLDYALGHHGLIPERVEEITSVTTGRHRVYETPFGVFSYRPLPPARYAPGMILEGGEGARFLMAAPEKALADKVWCDKRFKPARIDDFRGYLLEDLRMDEARLAALDRELLATIAAAFSSRRIHMLVRFLERLAGGGA